MASIPNFTSTPRAAVAEIDTANTNRDGSGTLVDIISGATNGTRIEHIDIVAQSTTTAGMVRLFINDGSISWLWREVAVTAITPGGTTRAFNTSLDLTSMANALLLPNGYKLQAATNNSESFNVFAFGGDF